VTLWEINKEHEKRISIFEIRFFVAAKSSPLSGFFWRWKILYWKEKICYTGQEVRDKVTVIPEKIV
jgi:hypothetical protein